MAYVKKILFNWNICRMVRIAGGTPILIMGIRQQHWPTILFGAVFIALGLFTTQCCAGDSCLNNPANTYNSEKKGITEFEEIKNN